MQKNPCVEWQKGKAQSEAHAACLGKPMCHCCLPTLWRLRQLLGTGAHLWGSVVRYIEQNPHSTAVWLLAHGTSCFLGLLSDAFFPRSCSKHSSSSSGIGLPPLRFLLLPHFFFFFAYECHFQNPRLSFSVYKNERKDMKTKPSQLGPIRLTCGHPWEALVSSVSPQREGRPVEVCSSEHVACRSPSSPQQAAWPSGWDGFSQRAVPLC